MFGVGIVELAVLLSIPLVLVLVVLAIATGALQGPRATESGRVVAARFAGLFLGLAGAAWLTWGVSPLQQLGRGLMLAPVAIGIGLLLGVIVGETVTRPRPDGPVRVAVLAPRRVLDHVPRALSGVVGLLLAAATATLTFTTVTASADDMGRAGRSLARACTPPATDPELIMSSTRGPYPGSFYSVPLAAGLLLALLLAVVALHQVVRRPRGTSADGGHDVLRRRSATAVVAALGVAIAGPLIGIAALTGSALSGHSCAAPGWPALGLGFLGLALLSLLALAWCTLALIWPAVALRRSPAPAPGDGVRR